MKPPFTLNALLGLGMLSATLAEAQHTSLSGIYPHLAMFNNEGECGTGAVVPWADRLWVVTYAPHSPRGSSDKLYEITEGLEQIVRPESIGGTPANRMIHRESKQLFIGPYAVDAGRTVRAIPYSKMFGRHTGLARHLADPEGKIVYATMEEGVYEVDVDTLDARELWGDEQTPKSERKANLPGYHGKGFYSGQGVYVYSNNGEHGSKARVDPETPSGVLAEWDGKAGEWTVVRRNQFTEVTGPGGIFGNADAANDPIWAVGWDFKSLLLGVRMPREGWTFYRLPKGSHSYDGAHGWNTEWPRIREIGEKDLLMTMHGTFWKFPKDFTPATTSGIVPMSNYLKVIGDFCRWKDHVVMGCDDTANSEFLNKRKVKGHVAAPQSQSNLWFVKPADLENLGPVIGRGAVWQSEDVEADQPSDAFLFGGYDIRGLHFHHQTDQDSVVRVEVDRKGDGRWSPLTTIRVPAHGYVFTRFTEEQNGVWVRLRSDIPLSRATAVFTYRNADSRGEKADPMFAGLGVRDGGSCGLVRARAGNTRSLAFAAMDSAGKKIGYYEMGADMKLRRKDDQKAHAYSIANTAMPAKGLTLDMGSVVYTDESGKRWRLPKGDLPDEHPVGSYRIAREVATERDLLHAHGTFYELPALNAGGISKLRAVTTHNLPIHDFCSYRGLFIMSGVDGKPNQDNPHLILSDDRKAALWAGAIDDIWKMGKPRGKGGPWCETKVRANEPSDPYLMTGYDRKRLKIGASTACNITAEVDLTGTGHWVTYQTFALEGAKQKITHDFPREFQAYWIRFVSDEDASVTTELDYR